MSVQPARVAQANRVAWITGKVHAFRPKIAATKFLAALADRHRHVLAFFLSRWIDGHLETGLRLRSLFSFEDHIETDLAENVSCLRRTCYPHSK